MHLGEAGKAEVLADVVVGEVPEAGHPHVGGDEHADRIVYLRRSEVVVHQEEDLEMGRARRVSEEMPQREPIWSAMRRRK